MKILILSGGGAKGNYQRGVLKNFNLEEFDLVGGTSVGSLNGLAVAMGRENDLDDIWGNIKNKDVYKGKMSILRVVWALIKKRNYILDYTPLLNLLKSFKGSKLVKDFVCNTIDLTKERQILHYFKKGEIVNDKVIDAVLASSTIPLIFKPVNTSWVDGGLVSNSVLGDVLDVIPQKREQVKEIVCINCNVRETKSVSYSTLLEMGATVYSKLMTNLVHDDVNSFISINKNIKNKNLINTKHKYIPLLLIEPKKRLTLNPWDFDNCHYLFNMGLKDGKKNIKKF